MCGSAVPIFSRRSLRTWRRPMGGAHPRHRRRSGGWRTCAVRSSVQVNSLAASDVVQRLARALRPSPRCACVGAGFRPLQAGRAKMRQARAPVRRAPVWATVRGASVCEGGGGVRCAHPPANEDCAT